MFWWLWSPKKKILSVVVIVVAAAVPVVLVGRGGEPRTTTSSDVTPSAPDTVNEVTSSSAPVPVSSAPATTRPTPSVPLQFAADSSRSATSVLPRAFLPLRDALVRDVLLPQAGPDGYSLYVTYIDVDSVEGLAGQQMLYLQQFGGAATVREVADEHFVVDASGEDQGVSFNASLQVIRAAGGAVISGVVRITGTPVPLTAAEIAALEELQEIRRNGGSPATTSSTPATPETTVEPSDVSSPDAVPAP